MGKLLFVFIVLMTGYGSLALKATEKYYVTFVKGEVALERTKAKVKVGDALNPEDRLLFKDKAAKVSCISPGKGRFDITSQAAKPGNKGELLAVLKSNLVPASGSYHLSTRSLFFEGYDPKTYFHSVETNNRILLVANETVPVSSAYKLDPANFFFLQYQQNGKTELKKLEHTEKGIVFPLLFPAGAETPEKVKLCYQTDASGTARSSVIAEFIPVVASKEEVQKQIQLLKEFSGGTDAKKLKKEILYHLFENYGKIGEEILSSVFGI